MKERFLDSAIILAITTASLYILGSSFHESYLAFWSIHATLFPLSVDQILLKAFFAGFMTLFFTVVVMPALVLFIAMLIELKGTKLGRGFFDKIKSKEEGESKAEMVVIEKCTKIFFRLFSFALLSIGIVFSGNYFGKEFAETAKYNYIDKEVGKVSIRHGSYGSFEGYLIICSENNCAFYINNTTRIFSRSDIKEINPIFIERIE